LQESGAKAERECEENTLLLDRKKIRKWAKWVALILAVIFGASFLFLGVGYGGAGFDISSIFKSGCSSTATTEPKTDQDKLNSLLQTIQANPKDTTSMLAAATIYQSMYQSGQSNGIDALRNAAALLENAIAVDPTLKDVYIRLANMYMSDDLRAYEPAVAVLNKAASADPTNPEVFLKLGTAQRNLGNKEAAVLAWQKYLELAPNGEMASVIRDQLETLTATTTTTAAATTTTAAGSSTTTTSGSTTTSASATSTTAP
jgi:cytochrome c-type biogenesis protein CcmH/NrfG